MKKYFLLTFIVALFVALPTQAQLKFGLKAGVNLSDVDFGDVPSSVDPSNYTGFQVGPILEFTVPIIGIGMDAALLYSQTGFKMNDNAYKNGSILIPVNLKYKLSLMNLVGAYAAAGPYIDFNVYDNLDDYSQSFKTESFGAGLNFGIGAELLGKLQIGVNYQLGLTDNFKNFDTSVWGLGGTAIDINSKPRVWSITAALFF